MPIFRIFCWYRYCVLGAPSPLCLALAVLGACCALTLPLRDERSLHAAYRSTCVPMRGTFVWTRRHPESNLHIDNVTSDRGTCRRHV